MANLLANASLWTSRPASNSPPEYWNGTTYQILQPDIGSEEPADGITLLAPAPSGATLYSIVTPVMLDPSMATDWFLVVDINGSLAITDLVEGVPVTVDYALTAGDAVSIYISSYPNGFAGTLYDYEVIIDPSSPPPPPPPALPLKASLVYELDRGWTFDGNYIPHFIELNWFFGDDPVTYKGIQKIRIHGLTKGNAYLKVATSGMQTDYLKDYSEAQYIDLLSDYLFVSSDFTPVTEYVDSANRGLSIQMKFTGRNTDITKPEPAHVLQALVLQTSPADSGKRAN